MKIYIIPEINSQKKLYIRSLFTEIKGYLTASLAIYNGKAKILLEVVTSKMLFRWGLNLVRLCLEFSEFPALEKCEKLWFHLILSQKPFFWKIPQLHTLSESGRMFLCHPWCSNTNSDMKMFDTWAPVTWGLRISE